MAKINFYLKGAVAKATLESLKKGEKEIFNSYMQKPLPLILYCSYEGQRVSIPMGVSIQPKYWDSKRMMVKESVDTPKSLENINEDISQVVKSAKAHIDEIKSFKKVLKKENLLSAVKQNDTNPNKKVKFLGFIEAVNYFINNHKKKNEFDLDVNTIKNYTALKNHLEDFISKYYPSLHWSDINKDFMRQFQDYFYNEKGCYDNTVTKYLKIMKTFIRYIMKEGVKIDMEALEFKVEEFEPPVIVLELAEIEKLIHYEFKDRNLGTVRDVFIFMCWTGQRYSDIKQIKRSDITTQNGNPVWLVTTEKTKESLIVPLTEYALEILDKYKDYYNPVPSICDQHFNRQLKLMAKEAELNRLVRVIKRKRGVPIQTSEPLYSIITSHIGRKSFITNALILGMTELQVKKISGHKDDRSFRRYVELGDSIISKAKKYLSKEKVREMIKFLDAS